MPQGNAAVAPACAAAVAADATAAERVASEIGRAGASSGHFVLQRAGAGLANRTPSPVPE